MSGAERDFFKNIFPEKARKGRGMSAAHPHNVLNSLLFILVTSTISARRSLGIKKCWLKAWHSDGRLKELQAPLLGAAQNEGLICWKSGAADGSFSLRKRRWGGGCAHGYEGKGVLSIFLLTLIECHYRLVPLRLMKMKGSMSASSLRRLQGRPCKNVRRLAADKGYDADALRNSSKERRLAADSTKKECRKKRGRPMRVSAPRFQAGRTFSWLQRKFRHLAIRSERLPDCFDAFLSLALCFIPAFND